MIAFFNDWKSQINKICDENEKKKENNRRVLGIILYIPFLVLSFIILFVGHMLFLYMNGNIQFNLWGGSNTTAPLEEIYYIVIIISTFLITLNSVKKRRFILIFFAFYLLFMIFAAFLSIVIDLSLFNEFLVLLFSFLVAFNFSYKDKKSDVISKYLDYII